VHKDNQFHRYTPEEINFIKSNIIGRSVAEMTEMFNQRFNCPITLKQMWAFLSNRKLRNGLRGKYPEYYFKKGHKPKHCMPAGSERIVGMGYKEVKTASGIWKSKHAVIWEEANGPVRDGHTIIFADGNKSNIELDNLLMVSKSELAVMNRLGLISSNADLTRTGKLIADICLLISDRKRKIKKSKKPQCKPAGSTGPICKEDTNGITT
jgi:hypothetical protein